MPPEENTLVVGATRKGKTLSAARAVVESSGAAVILDPHKQSLAQAVLAHAASNLLYACLSDLAHVLGFELLTPSANPDPLLRQLENHRRAEAFVQILMRRRDGDGMAATPLIEEWVMAAIMMYLYQRAGRKPPAVLQYAFTPGSEEFAALVSGCELTEIAAKFRQLEKLKPRALRAEVGSASRLVNSVFGSPAFAAWSRGGFDLGGFLQRTGRLVVERGEDIGDDTMRTIMGAIVLLVVEHAKRRPQPHPPIRVVIDEATNARLVGAPELRGLAETNKNGLYWTLLVQNLNFPGGADDDVLQNCTRHEWFGCPYHDLARKAAADVLAGLPRGEQSRAERLAELTHEIMTLPPGWRWVRDASGSRKEYVPLLEQYPDWPGLREHKLMGTIQWIHSRTEYRAAEGPPSASSSNNETPPSDRTRDDSSPAKRLKQILKRSAKKRAGGSEKSNGGSASG
jgi:hypothetical protein